jgi:glutathione peroxidase
MPTFHDFEMKTIDGKPKSLAEYAGKVVLVVNVASKCGLTPQYEGLEALYRGYQDRGLVVLGFPCNQFLWQERGSDEEIKGFCSSKYDVTFPMFSKIKVNGGDAAPLYKYLREENAKPAGSGRISWNFEKFLIGKDGKVLARFSPRTTPDDTDIRAAIEKALAQ